MLRLDAARAQAQRRESSGVQAMRHVSALEDMHDEIETLIGMRNALWSQAQRALVAGQEHVRQFPEQANPRDESQDAVQLRRFVIFYFLEAQNATWWSNLPS